jgi:NADH-quinone oxidoreductase subunit G
VLCVPGAETRLLHEAGSGTGPLAEVAAALREAGDAGLVLAGPRLAGGRGAGAAAAWSFAAGAGARFAYVTRRANDRGALLAGVHPRLLPGGRRFEDPAARAEVEQVWGPVMAPDEGRNQHDILRAAAAGELDVLFLIGVDPLTDHPDADLARRALDNVPVKIVQSLELGSLEPYADAFLPAAPFVEKDGHVTTWEGRGQRIRPARPVEGISRPDWEIFVGLAEALGDDLGFGTLDELHEEMGLVLAPSDGAARTGTTMATGYGEPSVPEGAVLLCTYPLLVDEGRLSERADELKAALEEEAFVEVHPSDAAIFGLTDGGRAVVRTETGEAELPVRVTEHVASGVAFVPFNNPGLRANVLLSGSFTTTATFEAVAAPDAGAEASAPEEVPA